MTTKDPRPKLRTILRLCEGRHLPSKVQAWAGGALETTEGIYATMEDMEMNGKDVPTSYQEEALQRIYCAACRWLR